MKLENEIKSMYTALKANLDERIQNNNNYDDDDRRQLAVNTNSERNLQDNKIGYYYEYWNASVYDLLEVEDSYVGYYYGFFITEDKFIYINQSITYDPYYRKVSFGIKLVTKITNQENCIY